MTQKEKNDYRNADTIAIYCAGYHGLEVKAIENGWNDYIVYQDSIDGAIRRRVIEYTMRADPEKECKPFFRDPRYGRVYLDEVLRT